MNGTIVQTRWWKLTDLPCGLDDSTRFRICVDSEVKVADLRCSNLAFGRGSNAVNGYSRRSTIDWNVPESA
jgi:hypothetical protein